ncbi:MAG: MazG family protein, partial [Actinomycetota bacterium]|nr:MazG family protein [Actinomycetota bacterium]
MGRLAVILTSPRLPAGLLTPDAWRAIQNGDLVAVADAASPLAAALTADGVDVEVVPDAGASDLIARAEAQDVVWLAADDGDGALTKDLADLVVRRSESGSVGPEVEIIVGSFDPAGARLLDAVTVMDTLRRQCPWDKEQTHESLVPYLVEEAYEVIEAIEGGDLEQLREELGDLLLQVLFHARLGAEHDVDPFTIDDVAESLVDKLVRRHPHVFSDTEVSGRADVEANWEHIKQAEKGRESVVDGIPSGLPALSLADSVIGRALRAETSLSVPLPAGETAYTEETLG